MRLFKQRETEVILHWSLLIPFGLVITRPGNLVLMLLIFVLVLAHEFGHIFVARRFGTKCPKVILCAIGGLAVMDHEPKTPGAEFAVAFAGPLVNIWFIAMAAMFANLIPHWILVPFIFVNALIAIFNIIPAFPMDGGRMLRAGLWKLMGKKWATKICQFLSIWLGCFGVVFAIQNGLWMLGMVAVSIIVMVFVPEDKDEQESIPDQVDAGTGSGRPASEQDGELLRTDAHSDWHHGEIRRSIKERVTEAGNEANGESFGETATGQAEG